MVYDVFAIARESLINRKSPPRLVIVITYVRSCQLREFILAIKPFNVCSPVIAMEHIWFISPMVYSHLTDTNVARHTMKYAWLLAAVAVVVTCPH